MTLNKTDRIVISLGKQIVSGKYVPGSALPAEAELCEEFETSRNIIREVFRSLMAKRLIEMKRYRGAFVAPRNQWNYLDTEVLQWVLENDYDPRLISAMSEVRNLVEPAIARWAAERATSSDLAEIESALNDMIANGYITEDQAKMGYVGAFTYAEVISGYTSFYLGAKSVCPSVTMDVTFTGSWYDETAEKEGANKLIANGCVLISQHADSMGAPTACETAGVPNVSYNGSTQAACPNTFIVSSRIDWAPYYEYAITAAMNGEAIDADWTGTLATGSVVLTDVNTTAAAEGTQEAIDAVKAELENGTRHVFDCSTFTVKGETLTSSMADVNTDPNYTPDTEAIVDGYFAESTFRSAPYFDLQIDGINLLDTNFGG